MTMKPCEKEYRYEQAYQNRRISTDLWKYIPESKRVGVTNAFADSDGYWVWLDHELGGWVAYDGAEDCGMIHEYTIKDLREAIKTIRRRG